MIYYGNRTNYGQTIGILMLNTTFPRIPGDIGNATTFDYPVLYKKVECATQEMVVTKGDTAIIQPFIDAGMELIEQGARAIVTSCGFMAMYQKEMAAALPVPVFTSSLLQIPIVYSMLKPDQEIGIITANSESLGEKHFKGIGIEQIPKKIIGIQDTALGDAFLRNAHELDDEQGKRDMAYIAKKLVDENPKIGAIVLECTNLPPFAHVVRAVTGLPVFDIITLTDYVQSALIGKNFLGYM